MKRHRVATLAKPTEQVMNDVGPTVACHGPAIVVIDTNPKVLGMARPKRCFVGCVLCWFLDVFGVVVRVMFDKARPGSANTTRHTKRKHIQQNKV